MINIFKYLAILTKSVPIIFSCGPLSFSFLMIFNVSVNREIQFRILSDSEFHKTGAIYENVLCPYTLRLHLGVTSKDECQHMVVTVC